MHAMFLPTIRYLTIFILSVLFILSQSYGQNSKKAELTSEQAIEDIEWLIGFMEDVHIDPWAIISKDSLQNAFNHVRQQIESQGTISRSKFYTLILPAFHQLKDIHISLFLPSKYNDYVKSRKYFILLKIRIVEDMLINIDKKSNQLPFGARILSINGFSDSLIISTFRASSPSEGYNKFTKTRIVENSFAELFPLLFQIEKENIIQYVPFDSDETQTVTIKGMKPARNFYKSVYNQKNLNYHEVILYDSLKAALIKIPSFSDDGPTAYDNYLRFAFSTIQKAGTEHLILDFRGNEGGYAERGEVLLSYLIAEETPYVTNIIFKKSKMADEIFNQQSMDSPLLKRMYVLSELLKMKTRAYGTYDTVYYRHAQPHENAFHGKLYVLIDGMSISTTGLVCNSLRVHRGAVFIGEPGGFTSGGTFGQVIRFVLPNSRINGYMSTIRFNSNNDFTVGTDPFLPDIQVFETQKDIVEENDPVLEQTLNIIRNKQ